ncbi:MAG: mechanosensitive ion channel family protein [Chloroflexia bacterium]
MHLAERDTLRRQERIQRVQTIRGVLNTAVTVAVVLVGGTMVLRDLGVDIAPLLASVGVVGVALGFGAQALIRDVLAGLFILIEDQFSVGDTVSAAGVSGTVERMTLRTTVLRDPDGTVHFVPNGEMRVVSNRTRGWSQLLLRVTVPYHTDLEKALEVLQRTAEEMAADPAWKQQLLEGPTVSGVEELRESGMTLLIALKTPPGTQWAAARELRRRVVTALRSAGIEMALPTRAHLTRVAQEEGSPGPGA